MQKFKNYINKMIEDFKNWGFKYQYRFFIFNIIIIFFFLLRSAGYFQPFFPISVNFIVSLGLILAVFLLGAKSRIVFFATLIFWVFAGFLRVLKIDVWAERTGIYAFESLLLGSILILFENFRRQKR